MQQVDNKTKCITGYRHKKKDTFIKVFADLILRQIVQFLFNTKLKELSGVRCQTNREYKPSSFEQPI